MHHHDYSNSYHKKPACLAAFTTCNDRQVHKRNLSHRFKKRTSQNMPKSFSLTPSWRSKFYKNLYIANLIIANKKAGLLTQVSAFSFTFPVSQWYLTMYLNHTLSAKENSAFTVAGPYEIHTHFPIILYICRHLL